MLLSELECFDEIAEVIGDSHPEVVCLHEKAGMQEVDECDARSDPTHRDHTCCRDYQGNDITSNDAAAD